MCGPPAVSPAMTGPDDGGSPPGYEQFGGTWSAYRQRRNEAFGQNPLNQSEDRWLNERISQGWFRGDVSPESRKAARNEFIEAMRYGHGDRNYQFQWSVWRSEYRDREYPPGSFEPRDQPPPDEPAEGESPEEYRQRTRDERRLKRQYDQQRKGKPITGSGWDDNPQGKEFNPTTRGGRGDRGKGSYLTDDPFARFNEPSPGGSPFKPVKEPKPPKRRNIIRNPIKPDE